MAKPAFSKLKRLFFWLRTHKLVSIALAFAVLIVGFFVYEKIALELNKRAFQNARTAIDAVYVDIVKNVGPPDNNKHESSCSRPSQVYGQGPLSCDVSTSLIYAVTNKNQANTYLSKIQNILSNNKRFRATEPPSTEISNTTVVNTTYQTATDPYKAVGLNCYVSYVFDTPREISLTLLNNKQAKPFQVDITCSGNARSKYY